MQLIKRTHSFLVPIFLLALLVTACNNAEVKNESKRSKAPQEAVEKWKDLRFGMFIHWGPVSLTGHEIGWSRGGETPIEEYDNLYKRFNPVKFDADEWVRVAKAAGMKYIVLTTKHHDGFCLWNSEYTEYNITGSPFKRDVVGELSAACRKAGLGFGTYYSVCDWWHPLYPKGGRAGTEEKPNGDMDKYMEYLQNQTSELVEKYGPLTCMWFDVPRDVEAHQIEPTLEKLRELQPNLVINNRAYYDDDVADFETPEQNLGTFNRERAWETNMTIANQWAWKPNDKVKSLPQCLQGLIYSAGGDGNFLFNVGPDSLGVIEPEQVKRLEEMGEWVNRYSEGIYETRGGPFKPSGWGASTHKENVIYLYVVRWQKDGKLILPLGGSKILKIENLSGENLNLEKGNTECVISVSEESRGEMATVIRLTVDKQSSDIAPVDMGSISNSLAFKKLSKASSILWDQIEAQGPHQAFDDNPGSHWVPDGKEKEWIEIDLGEIQTVDSVLIEQQHAQYAELLFQMENDGKWETIFSELKFEGVKEKDFSPVQAQKFRIVLFGGQTHLSELQLFNSNSAKKL